MLDLIRVLTITTERQEGLADLLERVCNGVLIPRANFPLPSTAEREVPA